LEGTYNVPNGFLNSHKSNNYLIAQPLIYSLVKPSFCLIYMILCISQFTLSISHHFITTELILGSTSTTCGHSIFTLFGWHTIPRSALYYTRIFSIKWVRNYSCYHTAMHNIFIVWNACTRESIVIRKLYGWPRIIEIFIIYVIY